MSQWLEKAANILSQSLYPIPHEINSLDWKLTASPKENRLAEHLSAFANLAGGGYLVFGIDPFGKPHGLDSKEIPEIVHYMTNVSRDGILPAVQIDHAVFAYPELPPDRALLVIHIPEAIQKPVHLRGKGMDWSFIRSGGTTRKMDELEIRQAVLSSRSQRFEELPITRTHAPKILESIDCSPVCIRLGKPIAQDQAGRLNQLIDLGFAVRTAQEVLPTYLGVIVASKDLKVVPECERYGVRVTLFRGTSKLSALKELEYPQGYVHCFDRLIEDIVTLLPHSEVLERATRKTLPMFPETALRELIANALVHRDYSRTDGRVQIEIFDDRIEITSPGSLLPGMEVNRLMDQQPRTRNKVLTSCMRQLGFCEERGSGIDRAAMDVAMYGLPAIEFIDYPDSFRAILYAPKPYLQMTQIERIRTAYQHTCLHFVMRKDITNASFRERLKLKLNQSQLVSKLIRQTIEANLIKIANPGASPRYIRYIPYWG